MTQEQFTKLAEVLQKAVDLEKEIKAIRECITALLDTKGATLTINVGSGNSSQKKQDINAFMAGGGIHRMGNELFIHKDVMANIHSRSDLADALRYANSVFGENIPEPKRAGFRLDNVELSDTTSVRVLDIILMDKKVQLEKYREEIIALVVTK